MKKSVSVLILSALPTLALAAGDHGGAHGGHEGHDMASDRGAMSPGGHGEGFGQPGDPARVSRVIDVTMDDNMRFAPDSITVKAGETVRFFVHNTGKMPHEMVIGPMAELKAHAAMMRAQPAMQHAEANMIALKPGQRGGIVWRFDQAGAVDFACLLPGHLEAGMAGKIVVQ